MRKNQRTHKRPPVVFRPLLWSLDWNKIDVARDKEDIVVNTVNEGTLDEWRWLIKTYGKKTIHDVLARRLATEFHPESRNLAKLIFNIRSFRNARRSVNTRGGGAFSSPR